MYLNLSEFYCAALSLFVSFLPVPFFGLISWDVFSEDIFDIFLS